MGRVGLGKTHGFDKFSLLLLLYWVEKNININILKKPKDYYQCNFLKATTLMTKQQ